jgi:ABC-type lipoprotein export system ATPase subunit
MKIEIKNLVKIYKNNIGEKVHAIDGITYTFPEKGMVFLVGKSGCGKTTLLNTLGMLDTFDQGEYYFDGRDVGKMSIHEKDLIRGSSIGFIFQQFHIIGKYSIGRNISLAKEISDGKCTKAEVEKVLEEVNLPNFYRRKASTMSGGQLQRAAIARAIIKKPLVILADEPTGALDSKNSQTILEILQKISLDHLVIVVTHDRLSATAFADQIVELSDGKIIGVSNGNQK